MGRLLIRLRYAIPILGSLLALLLSLLFADVFGSTPFLLFFGVVAVSAWVGGLGPGVIATVLGALAGTVVLLRADAAPIVLTPTTGLQASGFVLVGVLISYLTASLQSSERRARVIASERDKALGQTQQALEETQRTQDELVRLERMRALGDLVPLPRS